MSLSHVAIEQREKETKSHSRLLIWTVPGSIALHLAALIFGVNFPWQNKQQIVDKPIEILMLEPKKIKTPIPIPPKPKPPKIEKKKIVPKPVIKKFTRGGDGKKPIIKPSPRPIAKVPKPIAPPPKPIFKQEPIPPKPEPTPQPIVTKRPLPPLPPLPLRQIQPQPAIPSQQTSNTFTNENPRAEATENSEPVAKAGNRGGKETGTGGDGSGGKVSCLECPKPDYPDSAREREVEGKVKVAVDIDADGNVIDVKVANSSGHTDLDEAALEKAKEWKFDKSKSGRKGMVIAINFKLEDAI
jgi:TonB family protein